MRGYKHDKGYVPLSYSFHFVVHRIFKIKNIDVIYNSEEMSFETSYIVHFKRHQLFYTIFVWKRGD